MDVPCSEDGTERAGIGGLRFAVICDALEGSRKVLASRTRGWSSVTQRQIVAMACVVALFDPEREDVMLADEEAADSTARDASADRVL